MWVVVELNERGNPTELHGIFPVRWRAEQWANKYLLSRARDGWEVHEVSRTLERQD